MDVKEAVALAKTYLKTVFSDERILDLGLEEVEFEETRNIWSVTLGFSRPWDVENPVERLQAYIQPRHRSYKIVRISDLDKKVVSVKNREPVE